MVDEASEINALDMVEEDILTHGFDDMGGVGGRVRDFLLREGEEVFGEELGSRAGGESEMDSFEAVGGGRGVGRALPFSAKCEGDVLLAIGTADGHNFGTVEFVERVDVFVC